MYSLSQFYFLKETLCQDVILMLFFLFSFLIKIRKFKYQKKKLETNSPLGICNPSTGYFVPPCPQGYGIKRNCIICASCNAFSPSGGCVGSYQY